MCTFSALIENCIWIVINYSKIQKFKCIKLKIVIKCELLPNKCQEKKTLTQRKYLDSSYKMFALKRNDFYILTEQNIFI